MKQARISDLKNNLSRYVSYVRRGGIVRVYDRDRPVAELVPLGANASASAGEIRAILDELDRKGVIRRRGGKLPADFLSRALPQPKASVVAALLEERREGR